LIFLFDLLSGLIFLFDLGRAGLVWGASWESGKSAPPKPYAVNRASASGEVRGESPLALARILVIPNRAPSPVRNLFFLAQVSLELIFLPIA
jgi:hypothetical protein